ncbi:hypothetical protein JQC67_02790 [Aurantibacter crassamenti]|uniref:hypothetical protein n=1 Tax=Aurantibacter crassamenti TaxID=1837375 RepID=UPI001939B71B|nr:hypothetical protein [Aurantibacter crassamenti]MBM1105057.1 hypothetical protein [Aurantibacter crassamenti]
MKNNPFHTSETDRHYLWEMLVNRDIKAFVLQDWNMVANDFIVDGFVGIDAMRQTNVDNWELKYPNLEAYKYEWLSQAKDFSKIELTEDKLDAFHRVTDMKEIEISNDVALLHKKFSGSFKKKDGEEIPTNWQTLYNCRKVDGVWKITGFTGYIPLKF